MVESGVTTRTQLLAAVNALQRLGVATVGFVLNRVKLAKADPAFRHALRDIEQHLQAQSMSASRRTARANHPSAEPVSETRELPRETAVAPPSAPAVRAPEPSAQIVIRKSKAASVRAPNSTPVQPRNEEPMADNDSDPWWLSDARPQRNEAHWQPLEPHKSIPREPMLPAASSAPVLPPRTPQVHSWESLAEPGAAIPAAAMQSAEAMPASAEPGDEPSAEPRELTHWIAPIVSVEAPPEAGEEAGRGDGAFPDSHRDAHRDSYQNSYEAESRLNGLRGMCFSLGAEESDQGKKIGIGRRRSNASA